MDAVPGRPPHVVVVGGGITGLVAAHELRARHPHLSVTLVEAGDHLGGKIRTVRVGGFVVEGGPDSLMTFKPAAIALARELGLGDELIPADERTAGSHVLRNGRLRPLPAGMNGFMPQRVWPIATTRLLPPATKLRMALEVAVPRRHDTSDESVESFVSRRLGRGAYQRLVEPMVGAIFAADPAALSVEGTLPHLPEAERHHGGLVRSVLAQRRTSRRAERTHPGGPRPPALVAPEGGMGRLVEALAEQLPEVTVVLRTRVTGLEADGARYLLALERDDGRACTLHADGVVLAVPAPVAATVLERVEPFVAETLRRTPYSSTVTVSLGYRAKDVPELPTGHGYLVPQREGRVARAATWTSRKFPGTRAPDGHVLLRVSLGGAGRPSLAERTEDDLVSLARHELSETLGITAEPVLSRVFCWTGVMPQYAPGHLDRLAEVDRRLSAHPRLVLAGSGFHGTSVSDCVVSAQRAAGAVVAGLATALGV